MTNIQPIYDLYFIKNYHDTAWCSAWYTRNSICLDCDLNLRKGGHSWDFDMVSGLWYFFQQSSTTPIDSNVTLMNFM